MQVRRPRNDACRNNISKLIDHEDIWPSYWKGFAEGVSALHGAMNERFELVPDKRYSDTRHIVMV